MAAILQNLADATDAMNNTIRENRVYLRETLRNVDTITTNGAPELAKILANVRADHRRRAGRSRQPDRGRAARRRPPRDGGEPQGGDEDLAGDAQPRRLDRRRGSTAARGRRAAHQGRDAHQRGAGGCRRGQRLRRRHHAPADDRRPPRPTTTSSANTIKSYVSLRLQPREDKYYEIELINDPRGYTSYVQQDVDNTNPMLAPRTTRPSPRRRPTRSSSRSSSRGASGRSRDGSASRSQPAASVSISIS